MSDNLDVMMGSFDSTWVVDLYILDMLGRFINLNTISIYRDDGLISIPNSNGPLTSKLRKKVIRAFKYLGLKIESSSNFKIVNFLDVILNLNDNSYKPFSKINTIPIYINVNSNHPTTIIKQIPEINIRINRVSSSKNIFNNHKEFYNVAIHNSANKNELKYLETKRHHNNGDNSLGNYRTNNNKYEEYNKKKY